MDGEVVDLDLLSLDRLDVLELKEGEGYEDLEDGDLEEGSSARVEEEGVGDVHYNLEVSFPDRLIKDTSRSGLGRFPGFFTCDWSTGQMCPFVEEFSGSHEPNRSPSPTTRIEQQVFLGSDLMRATYRLCATFHHLGETREVCGSAVALSPHKLVTAAHNARLTVFNHTTKSAVRWTLNTIRVLSGEFVLGTKIRRFGFTCKILEENAQCTWGSSTVCPQDGSDYMFLEVEEALPSFALPCSPQQRLPVVAYGYPGALSFLLRARKELVRKDTVGVEATIWRDYLDIIWDDLKDFILKHGGDMAKAEEEAKAWLFGEFKKALSGISEGAQTVSAGYVEAMTPSFIGHTCATLTGLSGGAIAPMEVPGYICGVHDGSLTTNQNVATSTDNPLFVKQYFKHILEDLPEPDWSLYLRPYFSISPFLSWLYTHVRELPSTSTWASFLQQQIQQHQQQQQIQQHQQQQQIQQQHQPPQQPRTKKRKLDL